MIMVLDTETTNDIESPIAYDIGYVIANCKGDVLLQRSFIVKEIFNSPLMEYAYFKDKIPEYKKEIENGKRVQLSMWEIREIFIQDIKDFAIKEIAAHNALFDYRALNNLLRIETCSASRYFIPYGITMLDTLKMARQTFGVSTAYKYFCKKNEYLTKNKKVKLTAEIIYKWMSHSDFSESHTGLEDALIEKDIYFKCLKMNSKIDCKLFSKKRPRN